MHSQARQPNMKRQSGAAIVEFALICAIFISLLIATVEFGRMMYVYNSMQEISRRGAREATVRWITDTSAIKSAALFGAGALPGGPEVASSNIFIRYLRANGIDEVTTPPIDAGDNLAACNDVTRTAECIAYVEVSVRNVTYKPLIFNPANVTTSRPNISLPQATTVVYAESLGFTN